MSIKLISVKCPDCGAQLNIEEGRKTAFCSYCGAKVIVSNENEITFRHVDEANLKKAETERMVKLKQFELLEKRQAYASKKTSYRIKASILLALVGVGMIIIGYLIPSQSLLKIMGLYPFLAIMYIWIVAIRDKKDEEPISLDDRRKLPSGIASYSSMNYEAVEILLRDAGFRNVICIPQNDLTLGVLFKPGRVQGITVNGEYLSFTKKYPLDAKIVISYHSRSR